MQKYASRHRLLRSAEPDIDLLSQTPKSRHRRLSVCSLPVPKQFVESLGSLISFAQSAKCRTWQSAHGSSRLFSSSLQAAAVLRSSAGIKSLCSRSTASRYATIFRATASVARLPFSFLLFPLVDHSQLMALSRRQLGSFDQRSLDMLVALFGERHTHRLVRRASFVAAESAITDRVLDRAEA
jgi:hypothetical protein